MTTATLEMTIPIWMRARIEFRLPLLRRVLVVLVGLVGCSSSRAAPVAHDAAPVFSMTLDVAAGAEKFMCQLVTFPEGGYVTSESHDYTAGSHHFLLYTTDLASIPAGQGGVEDCNDNDGSIMNHVRGLFYAAQTPHAEIDYPAGVGMPITRGQVLLFQVHYLNAGSTPLHATVKAYFTIDPTGTTIHDKASILFWYDPFIDVPAGRKATAQMRCPVSKDITILGAAPHFHARGAGYTAYVDTAGAPPSATPFYTTGGWNAAEAFTGPLTVRGGSRIRFQCAYDNTSGDRDFFQGPSAATNEMCMFIATYFPALDSDSDFCAKDFDMYGTGETGCVDSLTCMGACGASKADAGSAVTPPPALPDDASSQAGEGTPTLDPCLQKCFAASCPAFSGTIMSMVTCMQQNCAVGCGLAPGDGGPTATQGDAGSVDMCTPCLEARCTSLTTTCVGQTSCGADSGP